MMKYKWDSCEYLGDCFQTHSQDIMSIGIDSIGNFVMTADLETKVDIFSIKGMNIVLSIITK